MKNRDGKVNSLSVFSTSIQARDAICVSYFFWFHANMEKTLKNWSFSFHVQSVEFSTAEASNLHQSATDASVPLTNELSQPCL